MAEYIKRKDVIETIRNEVQEQVSRMGMHQLHIVDMIKVEDAVNRIPSADVVERKTWNEDLISRQTAIDALNEHRSIFCDNTPETFRCLPYDEKCRVDEIDNAIATLINLPSAQPERKTGKWIFDCEITAGGMWTCRQYHCSSCGKQEHGGLQNYCPNCGARMVTDKEGE